MSSHWLQESYSEMNRQQRIEDAEIFTIKVRSKCCEELFEEEDLNEGGKCQECLEWEEKHLKNQ